MKAHSKRLVKKAKTAPTQNKKLLLVFALVFGIIGFATLINTYAADEPQVLFYEDFTGNTGIENFNTHVFQRNMDIHNYAGWGGGTWEGDHDLNCGSPDTHRTLRYTVGDSQTIRKANSFYNCVDHMMTAMGDVDGYSMVMFSPKTVFDNVSEVSWDVNLTDLGNRQWFKVGVISDYAPWPTGHGTAYSFSDVGASDVPDMVGSNRLIASWSGPGFYPAGMRIGHDKGPTSNPSPNDKRTRHPSWLRDNGNGTITLSIAGKTMTSPGSFPDCPCRVVFYDHKYTPDKSVAEQGKPILGYTLHWDNIKVTGTATGTTPPLKCEDPAATNNGGNLPCVYPTPVCEDDHANNRGQPLPCTYDEPHDIVAPQVSLTAPANNSSVSGTISVSATAADNIGVTRVSYYLDGSSTAFSNDTTAPYSSSLNTTTLTNGSHTITAKAFDAAGNSGTSSAVTINITNIVVDTTLPATTVTSPANNASISGNVVITATASDNIGVTKVELLIDGTVRSTDITSPYSFSWLTTQFTNGAHSIRTRAFDAAGNSSQSSLITVTVNNTTPVPDPSTPKLGDVNGDNTIDIFDLSILLSNWSLQGATRAQGDLNSDGVINIFDISILLSNWGK